VFNNFTKSNPNIHDTGQYAELLSIGVNPDIQGKGIGKLLLTNLEKKLKDKRIIDLSLTTDYYNNEKALKFYKALNYEIMYDFIAYPNRKMYRLIKKLT
jgi:ribosomal protein S18 acetylase RimI-like enzyme